MPGAVGGVLAVGLGRAGVPVVCVARPSTAALIASEGLTLKHGEEVETTRPEVVTELREPVDLLLVTVKAPALDDALGRIQATADTIVPLLNGIEHMETIRGRFPESKVVGGTIGFIEAWLERPGVIVQNTPRTVMTRRFGRRRRNGRAPAAVGCGGSHRRKRAGGALGEARAPGSRRRSHGAEPAADR